MLGLTTTISNLFDSSSSLTLPGGVQVGAQEVALSEKKCSEEGAAQILILEGKGIVCLPDIHRRKKARDGRKTPKPLLRIAVPTLLAPFYVTWLYAFHVSVILGD